MKLKGVTVEDFVNYKLPSMFLITCHCSWKCCTELGLDVGICQNSSLAQLPDKEISNETLYLQFSTNPITKAVVIGGLEPMIQINEIIDLIKLFRKYGEKCPFIIYTGYNPEEIPEPIDRLKKYENIIVKFGRFIPDQPSHFDEILGVELASPNQYGVQIS